MMDWIQETYTTVAQYILNATRCVSMIPLYNTFVDQEYISEYLFDLITLNLYLIIIIPLTGQSRFSNYVVTFTIFTFASMHFFSIFCLRNMTLVIPGVIVGSAVTLLTLKAQCYKYVRVISELYLLILGTLVILYKCGVWINLIVLLIVIVSYALFIKYSNHGDRKIFTRALVCTLLVVYMVNIGFISWLYKLWGSSFTITPWDLSFYVAKVGIIVVHIGHFLLLKYVGRFYDQRSDTIPLLPI